jgi:hypothetical protein|tara:strand:- start:377 stop:607 length:231 start_codon:yes stop_codon:yes gene_type:complete
MNESTLNLDCIWTKIAAVTRTEIIGAVLKDEVNNLKHRSMKEPHLHQLIFTLEKRIEELKADDHSHIRPFTGSPTG